MASSYHIRGRNHSTPAPAQVVVCPLALTIALLLMAARSVAQSGSPAQSRPAAPAAVPVKGDLFGDLLPPGAIIRLGTSRFRHGLLVTAVAFSPDGQTLASSGYDGAIRLWEAATGKEIRRFEGHVGYVESLAMSPDGRWLVSGGGDRTVRQWKVATGKQVRLLGEHQHRHPGDAKFPLGVPAVAYSPDGLLIASGGYDKTIRVWDAATGKDLWKAAAHTQQVSSLSFSSDSQVLASACPNQPGVRLWEARTGKQRGTIGNTIGTCARFSPNGQTLAIASNQGYSLWDCASSKEVPSNGRNAGYVSSLAWSNDGSILATSVMGVGVRLWKAADGQEIRRCAGHQTWGGSLAFSPDGRTLAGGTDRFVRRWEVSTGQEIFIPDAGHNQRINRAAISPDGRLIATAGQDATLRIWDAATGRETRCIALQSPQGLACVAFSPDGRTLAGGGNDRIVRLWNVADGKEIHQLAAHNSMVCSLAFSADGRTLASASYSNDDKSIRLWDVAEGKEIRRLTGHFQRLECVAFSSDGRTLASCSYSNDTQLRLWEATTGKQVRALTGHPSGARCLAFSPDGRTVISGGYDHTVRLWEASTGRPRGQLDASANNVTSVAFSPTGRLAAAAVDRYVRIWNLADGRQVASLEGHQGSVTSVTFSPDGRTLVSSSHDTTALIWLVPPEPSPAPAELDDSRFKALWAALAGEDAAEAYRTIWTLAASPRQALPFLRDRLRERAKTLAPPDPAQIAKLIADLDSNRFAVRERATKDLERMGSVVEPAVRAMLRNPPSPEARWRGERTLVGIQQAVPTPDRVQAARAIEALEQIGGAEARIALESLKDPQDAWLAREVNDSLRRMTRKAGGSP